MSTRRRPRARGARSGDQKAWADGQSSPSGRRASRGSGALARRRRLNRKLLQAALAVFAQRGYHGTTTRHIAECAEMSAAAIYTHYKSKAELLFRISWAGHLALMREMQAEFARSATPVQRLRNLVRCHVRFHARMHTAARVANATVAEADAPARD